MLSERNRRRNLDRSSTCMEGVEEREWITDESGIDSIVRSIIRGEAAKHPHKRSSVIEAILDGRDTSVRARTVVPGKTEVS